MLFDGKLNCLFIYSSIRVIIISFNHPLVRSVKYAYVRVSLFIW